MTFAVMEPEYLFPVILEAALNTASCARDASIQHAVKISLRLWYTEELGAHFRSHAESTRL